MISIFALLLEESILPTPAQAFAVIGQIAASLTAMGIIWRFAIRPVAKTVQRVTDMYTRVEKLMAQFERNGGSTIRDSLDRIERAVHVQEQRQKIMLGMVPFAVAETDARGKLIFANRTYLHWVGRTESEVLWDGWVNVIHPDDRERVRREWTEAVSEARSYEGQFRMLGTNSCFEVQCRAVPIRAEDPTDALTPFGWVAIIIRNSVTSLEAFALPE